MLAEGIPVDPIVTQIYPARRATEAFDMAGDRRHSSKVLLDFTK
jgi:hypothetical protein